MNHHNITVTDAAVAYIQKMLLKEQGIGLRLTIKKTGCSGYTYLPLIVKEVNAKDIEVECDDQVRIFIDATWLNLLNGIQIDYLEEDKLGLRQKRLVFINPNEKNRCGCGESFHVD